MDALDRQTRTAGWLYMLLVLPGPFVLIYLPSKLIVPGDDAATVGQSRMDLRSQNTNYVQRGWGEKSLPFFLGSKVLPRPTLVGQQI
jgi:hypothetical protein